MFYFSLQQFSRTYFHPINIYWVTNRLCCRCRHHCTQVFIQYLLFLFDFNQNWNVLHDFGQYVLWGKYLVLIMLTVSEDMCKNSVLSYVVKSYCVLQQDLQYILIQVIGKHAVVITMVLLSLFFWFWLQSQTPGQV